MAASTGIVLAATGIAAANDWYQTNQIPFKIGVAGLALALAMAGVEKISSPVATGLASIMLVTVLITPISSKDSPLGTAAKIFGGK